MLKRNFLKDQSARAYTDERFKNPFFRKENRWTKWKIVGTASFLFATIVGIISCFIFGPWLKINETAISGLTTVPGHEVELIINQKLAAKRAYFLPNNQRWIFDKQSLLNELNDRFHFSALTIELQKNTLVLQAEERISAVAWQSEDNYFLLTLNGQPTLELDPVTANSLRARQGIGLINIDPSFTDRASLILAPSMPIIHDLSSTKIDFEKSIIKAEFIQSIIDWDNLIRTGTLEPISYEIESTTITWITMKTKNGPEVLFDLIAPVEGQGKALNIILDEYSQHLSDLKTIDVRFGNNVFIK